ncbi:hypothetical protein [Dactylosporangium sp. NPDC049140]|uniref:hypothetical protein n=1 Tax=Dactylosporangium sp. NPDC049140 TaxID=3155647 RepID=UPI0033DC2E5D
MPFTINLAIVLSREIRIHHDLPSGHVREQNLTDLDRIRRSWRQRLDALTGR